MDSTLIGALIGALAGIIGGLIGAIIGGRYVQWSTARQIEALTIQTRGDMNERLYYHNLEWMRYLAENPKIRPYFYENRDLSAELNEDTKGKVMAAAEMLAGFFELVALHRTEILELVRLRWEFYIKNAYKLSPALRAHIRDWPKWYANELHAIVHEQELECEENPGSG